LTAAGEAYANEIREALRHISTATLGVRANPNGGSLNLAILPTFGTRWLAPRLPGFLAENPGITVNLTTRLAPFDFQFDQVDAAIHFGGADWSGAELEFLMGETVIPACSPGLREHLNIKQADDLLKAPLLHLVSRPDAWERWFQAKGLAPESVHGMLIDQFATAAQAATAGMGVALLPKFLIKAELARGDLVEAVNGAVESAGHYYLAWAPKRASYPPLQAFRLWLKKCLSTEGV
jgi:LysR family glycine cleavage system transcriptional activator